MLPSPAFYNDGQTPHKGLFLHRRREPEPLVDDYSVLGKVLSEASLRSNMELVTELVDRGPDINYADPTSGYTPLHMTAQGDQ